MKFQFWSNAEKVRAEPILANFGLFGPKCASVLHGANFFLDGANSWNLQELINNNRDTFEPKLPRDLTYKPIFLQKCDLGGPKIVAFAHFVNRAIKPLKNLFSSWGYSLLKLNFMCSQISPSWFWACWRAIKNASHQWSQTAGKVLLFDPNLLHPLIFSSCVFLSFSDSSSKESRAYWFHFLFVPLNVTQI